MTTRIDKIPSVVCISMRFGLGIDTGGTYTDSVVIDLDTKEVIRRNKALTTHDDLVVGIRESIMGLGPLGDIGLISLSTTLATNSVVERKGCRVGLLTIGKRIEPDFDVSCIGHIDGEFDMRGDLVTELDVDSARQSLEGMKDRVDSIAICGYLSVRYPEHEIRLKALADEILGVPVVCAHDLTSKLGFKERMNTAVMNASLIPRIIGLIDSVRTVLSELHLDAPLMIVKGDGSVTTADRAIERPADTVMSGPASSLTGAMNVPSVKDAIVVDIGGTTTDIGMVSDGFIHILDEGASICGHRTRVRAADICTYGLGGDTGMEIVDGRVVFSGRRCIPYCVASHMWGSIRERIANDADSIDECVFLTQPEGDPISLREMIGRGVDGDALERMESSGSVTRITLTPTDILAAEGRYDEYEPDASLSMVRKISSLNSMTPEGLLDLAREAVLKRLSDCIQDYIDRPKEELIETYGRVGQTESFEEKRMTTIVGIGAPSGSWLPKVAERMGYDIIIPDDFDVRNAVGAICSKVTEYAEVTIRAAPNDLSEDPQCRVYVSEDSFYFDGKERAMRFAMEEGVRIATEKAKASGAIDIKIESKVDEHHINDPFNRKRLYRGADILIKAFGEPVDKNQRFEYL